MTRPSKSFCNDADTEACINARLPAGFQHIRDEEMSRLHDRMISIKRIVSPLTLALGVYVGLTDPARWRYLLLLGLGAASIALSWQTERRLRREGLPLYRPSWDFIAVSVSLLGACFATGGLGSPLAPQIMSFALVLALSFDRRFATPGVTILVLGFWAFAVIQLATGSWMIPSAWLGAGRESAPFVVINAGLLSLFTLVCYQFGRGMREMNHRILLRSLQARDESLAAHAEQRQTMLMLQGQIAHELKNPLASVKGLAALVAMDLEGKPAERIDVLRREVDRMQGILDEFLNFTRPLVPLSKEQVDLRALSTEVTDLYEGLARERGLSVAVPSEQVEARCDPRKVKQIVINLVQNAIEANPDGGEVRVELERRDGVACLRVLDRGPGLPIGLHERIFDAGVTTKATGSGLGLTMARMLAEQHGGALRLANRHGGGCVAELELPTGAVALPRAAVG